MNENGWALQKEVDGRLGNTFSIPVELGLTAACNSCLETGYSGC